MATDYVNAIAAGLQEYQPGLQQQVYQDLAWGGLIEAPIFNTLYPVGNPNRQRILNRFSCEQSGHPVEQGTPLLHESLRVVAVSYTHLTLPTNREV